LSIASSRRRQKFIFSLSDEERIIASETISTMEESFPDFFSAPFNRRGIPPKSEQL
jgi:hypothetical protein